MTWTELELDPATVGTVLDVLRSIDTRLSKIEEAVPELQRPVLPMLATMADEITALKTTLDEYEPLIRQLRERMDRGPRKWFTPGGAAT